MIRAVLAGMAITSALANASLVSRICEAMIKPDPYQYESSDTAWLKRRVERLQIRSRWGRLTAAEAEELALMRHELESREMFDMKDVQ